MINVQNVVVMTHHTVYCKECKKVLGYVEVTEEHPFDYEIKALCRVCMGDVLHDEKLGYDSYARVVLDEEECLLDKKAAFKMMKEGELLFVDLALKKRFYI